jgi:hypothetical protein
VTNPAALFDLVKGNPVTTAAMHITPRQSILTALADLLGFGYGTARFAVGDDGELVHTGTVVTVKMRPMETMQAFLDRLRSDYDLRKDDILEIGSEGGKLNVARITRQPR